MGRERKVFPPEVQEYLRSYMPEYLQCQVAKKYRNFWKKVTSAYNTKFPVIAQLYPGRKYDELCEQEQADLTAELVDHFKRLKEWSRWRGNPRTVTMTSKLPTNITNKIYKEGSRAPKSHVVFARLFPDIVAEPLALAYAEDKVKREEAAAEAANGSDDSDTAKEKAKKAGPSTVVAWNRVCGQLWKEATNAQKLAVREAIEAEEDLKGKIEKAEEELTQEEQMKAIEGLPSLLMSFFAPLAKCTGISFFVTYVGKNVDGTPLIQSTQFGEGDGTPLFSDVWSGFNATYLPNLKAYHRRHIASGAGEKPQSPSKTASTSNAASADIADAMLAAALFKMDDDEGSEISDSEPDLPNDIKGKGRLVKGSKSKKPRDPANSKVVSGGTAGTSPPGGKIIGDSSGAPPSTSSLSNLNQNKPPSLSKSPDDLSLQQLQSSKLPPAAQPLAHGQLPSNTLVDGALGANVGGGGGVGLEVTPDGIANAGLMNAPFSNQQHRNGGLLAGAYPHQDFSGGNVPERAFTQGSFGGENGGVSTNAFSNAGFANDNGTYLNGGSAYSNGSGGYEYSNGSSRFSNEDFLNPGSVHEGYLIDGVTSEPFSGGAFGANGQTTAGGFQNAAFGYAQSSNGAFLNDSWTGGATNGHLGNNNFPHPDHTLSSNAFATVSLENTFEGTFEGGGYRNALLNGSFNPAFTNDCGIMNGVGNGGVGGVGNTGFVNAMSGRNGGFGGIGNTGFMNGMAGGNGGVGGVANTGFVNGMAGGNGGVGGIANTGFVNGMAGGNGGVGGVANTGFVNGMAAGNGGIGGVGNAFVGVANTGGNIGVGTVGNGVVNGGGNGGLFGIGSSGFVNPSGGVAGLGDGVVNTNSNGGVEGAGNGVKNLGGNRGVEGAGNGGIVIPGVPDSGGVGGNGNGGGDKHAQDGGASAGRENGEAEKDRLDDGADESRRTEAQGGVEDKIVNVVDDDEGPPSSPKSSKPESRRSHRAPVPSTRAAQIDAIGTNQARTAKKTKPAADAWFAPAQQYLRSLDLGPQWQVLLTEWENLEKELGFGNVSMFRAPLTVLHRPKEWKKWSRKRDLAQLPDINPVDLGMAVAKWWLSMQPPYRRPEDATARLPLSQVDPPDDVQDHWSALRKLGDSGFFSLIMLLSLWGVAAKNPSKWDGPSDPTWEQVVADVIACLPHIANIEKAPSTSNKAPKRARASGQGEGTGIVRKRARKVVKQSANA